MAVALMMAARNYEVYDVTYCGKTADVFNSKWKSDAGFAAGTVPIGYVSALPLRST